MKVSPPTADTQQAKEPVLPTIADYQLLYAIGRGAYGEVWLARNLTGSFVALKIVRRAAFDHDRPFEREFEGIKRFEPISRSDPSQVTILHVGRGEGFFYYVMELADDASAATNQFSVIRNRAAGPRAQPLNNDHCSLITSYAPKTLKRVLNDRGALPTNECLTIALSLTRALAHLHKHELVHRDVKPSNAIFVKGVAKLADIGLVTSVDATRSFVGTEGYLPPEGGGTPSADCYSLGKLLYELSTGHDRTAWPEPPGNLATRPDRERLLELNAILHRACAPEPRERYANAEAMLADLDRLGEGKSVRRARQVERQWRLIRHGAGWLAAAAAVATLIVPIHRVWQPPANPEVTKRSTNSVANDLYDLGRSFYLKSVNMEAATTNLEAAVAADPNFALAQALLATTLSYGGEGRFDYSFPTLSKALLIAKNALEKDDKLSNAHLVLAWHAYVREWDWKKASEHFKKAIRYDPDNSQAYWWYGLFLSGIGRINEAIRQLEMAERRNGQDLSVNLFFGKVLVAARQYPEAIRKLRKAAEMPDAQGQADRELAWARVWNDGTNDAIEQWVDAFYGTKEAWVSDLKRVLRDQGQTAFWNKRLEALRSRTKDPLILAEASAMAGQSDEALKYLEQAFRGHHDEFGANLKNGLEYDTLRGHPRFKTLVKAMRFPE